MPSPKALTPQQVQSFHDSGWASPVRVLTVQEAAGARAQLETFERAQGSPLKGGQRNKAYLLFRWAYDILMHGKVLDAVEDVIGPDFVCYHSTAWIKEARSPGFVSWHQDSTYFGLEPLDGVTVWVALSDASSQAGCMRVLPASHKLGQLPSDLRPHTDNLLTSGQTVKLDVDPARLIEMPLAPGEMSMHHVCTVHGSPGNATDDRRIGLCLHYIPAHVRPNAHLISTGALCSAVPVRGRMLHPHFPAEQGPRADNDAAAQAEHANAVASYRRMVEALGHMTASRHD